MKSNRKLISWRIDSLDQREQDVLNEWLDNQQNIQKSITNVVLHMINRFGTTDIMSFDNQKVLYTEVENNTLCAPVKVDKINEVEHHKEPAAPQVETPKSNDDDDDDSLYEGLNL